MSDDALSRCQQELGYQFKDTSLLTAALTHASVATSRLASNERLEFLGDSILGVVVCKYLFDNYPEYLEGELTKIKSSVVSGKTCAEISERIGLTRHLLLGNGISSRSRLPMSVSAAALEALIAAIALDGGFENAREFVLRLIRPDIEAAIASEYQQNYKSQLQQHAQKEIGMTPVYELLDEKGPDHSKCFEVAVCIVGERFPSAWGPSKKEAEQKAALNALIAMNLASALDPPAQDETPTQSTPPAEAESEA
jgi:ribonuclease III